MLLNKNEIDLILAELKRAGYQGFSKGKYIVMGSKIQASSAIKQLNLKEILSRLNLFEAAVKFEEVSTLMAKEMAKVRFVSDAKLNVESAGDKVSKNSSDNQIEILQNDISIYKTIRKVGGLDPVAKRSGGLSILAFNTKSRVLINGSEVSVDAILSIRGTDREEVSLSPNVKLVWPVFNPYTPELIFNHKDPTLSDVEVEALNTAIPPRWMTHADPVDPEMTGFIGKLVNHLFPNDVDRERVLDWCHYAIFKRNGTVLCLAGDRGTGKSTFVEILSELVGSQYAEIVGESILKEKFNSAFKNKRLVIFEEVALSESASINKVKAWCNNKISLEEKGIDQITADNFSSMVFLLNNLVDLKIAPQERRFSIPVVATENLMTVLTEKEIDKFKTGLVERTQESLNQIAEFGNFLKNRKPKFSEHIPIKGENFFRVADLALTEWQSYLRDFVRNRGQIGEIIPITVVFQIKSGDNKDLMKFPTKKPVLDDFLRDYRYSGTHKIGEIVDIKENDMAELEKKMGFAPSNNRQSASARTRRLYGIKPNENFLKEFGLKYKRDEDLL